MEKTSSVKEFYKKSKEVISEKGSKLFSGLKGLFSKKILETVEEKKEVTYPSKAMPTSGRIISLSELPQSSTPLTPFIDTEIFAEKDMHEEKEAILVGSGFSEVKKEEIQEETNNALALNSKNEGIRKFAERMHANTTTLLGEKILEISDSAEPQRAIFSKDEKIKNFALNLIDKNSIPLADEPEYIKKNSHAAEEWDSNFGLDTERGLRVFIKRAEKFITDEKIGNEPERMLTGRRAKNEEFRKGLSNIQEMLDNDIPVEDITLYAEKLKSNIAERYEGFERIKETFDTVPLPSSEETLKFYKEYGIEKEEIKFGIEKKQN